MFLWDRPRLSAASGLERGDEREKVVFNGLPALARGEGYVRYLNGF